MTTTRQSEAQQTAARFVRDWVDRGLLDESTARRLLDDLAAEHPEGAGVTQADEDRSDGSTVDRVLDAARTLAVETLGYLGAAVSVGATFVLLDVASWPGPVHVVLLAAVAAAATWGTVALTPPASSTTRRLAAVTAATAAVATAGMLAVATDPDCVAGGRGADACSWAQEHLRRVVVAVPTLVLATALYRRHRHALTHATLGVSVVASIWVVTAAVLAPAVSDEAVRSWTGLALGLAAAAWLWASETGRLDPPWLGSIAASGVLFAAVAMVTDYDPLFGTGDDDAAILAALLVGALLTAAGVLTDRVRLTVVGAIALLVTVPATLTEVFGLAGTTTALVLLPVGVALTIWAVVEGRASLAQGGDDDGRSSA